MTATTSTQEKIDWLLSLPNGPTNAANYKTEDFAAVVKEVTNGKGADVVIDFVGQSHFNKNLDALAVDGRMTMLALLSGIETSVAECGSKLTTDNIITGSTVQSVNLVPILYKRLHIEGSTLRSRQVEYQTDLITRYIRIWCDGLLLNLDLP